MDHACARLASTLLLGAWLLPAAVGGAVLEPAGNLVPGPAVEARLAGVTRVRFDDVEVPVPAGTPPGDGPVALLFPFDFDAPAGESAGVMASLGFDGFATGDAELAGAVRSWGITRLDGETLPRGVRARGPDLDGARADVDGRGHDVHPTDAALQRLGGVDGHAPFDAMRVGRTFDVEIDFPADAARGRYALWLVADPLALGNALPGAGAGRVVASFMQLPGRPDRALAHVAAGLEVPAAWEHLLAEPARFAGIVRLPDAVAHLHLDAAGRLASGGGDMPAARAIGAAESVNPDAFGTPPGRERRALAPADPVHTDETVQTDARGWARLVLADDSRLNIGSNTQLVLDEFVYDPDAEGGTVAMDAARGVFRFITGKVGAGGVRLQTPTALIGVRGTDFLVRITDDVPTRLWVLDGLVDVTSRVDNNTRVVQPYQSVSVRRDGTIVEELFEPPADDGLGMDPGYWTGGAPAPGGWQSVLAGKWTSTSGRAYEATGGAFSRGGFVNLRLACRTDTVRAVTPVYRCNGNWFEDANTVGGGYRARLYWDGPQQRWYLEGEYNNAASPDQWHGHNYAQGEGEGGSAPSLRVAMAAGDPAAGPPPAQGIDALQPAAADALPWARALNGQWTSTSGRAYEVYNGDFWRSHHLNMRLACGVDGGVESITPIYRCGGDWYESSGEVGGRYRARLWWDGPQQRWYLDGEYDALSSPGQWHSHNYAQSAAAGGAAPALRVAMTATGADAGAPQAAGIAELQPAAADTLPWARVLNGQWTSTSGRAYDLYNGDFWRSHHLNMRLACEEAGDIDAITPVFRCSGKWYEGNGQLGGGYRARLYWDGPQQRWYLQGEYSNADAPQQWHGHNYAQSAAAGGAVPAVGVAMTATGADASAPEAAGVAALQPAADASLPWARVLNGQWTSTSGRAYDLYNGDFWRSHHLNMRLACEEANDIESITPFYHCAGKWYETTGILGGYYRARLYWDGPQQRWYLEGEYNDVDSPQDWHGHNYAQSAAADGAAPALAAAMATAGANAGPPEAAGIAALQPAGGGTAWGRALSGKWTSTSGRGYDVHGGDFWRSRHLNMRLACSAGAPSDDGSPGFACTGTWYEGNGAAGGRYRARLSWQAQQSRWYLEGEYDTREAPGTWHGHNYAQTEGPGGAAPAL